MPAAAGVDACILLCIATWQIQTPMEVLIATLQLALGQYDTGWHDPAESLTRARRVCEQAARSGAQLIALPEMCTTGFTMDQGQAETLQESSVAGLSSIARDTGLFVLAGVATRTTRDAASSFHNTALLFGSDGSLLLEYRKQRLFGLAAETKYYAAGDQPGVAVVDGVRVAPFICYDLRFPELFGAVVHDADVMVVIANWPVQRRLHWDVLVHARAIENLCFFAAVNRTGEGGGASYDGGSAAYGPWGEPLGASGNRSDWPVVVKVDTQRVSQVRQRYPFMADR
jgi:predicted amidohydrolase